jgi:hypothetical protein
MIVRRHLPYNMHFHCIFIVYFVNATTRPKDGPQTFLRRPQRASRRFIAPPRRSKTLQVAPKTPPRRPKTPPKTPQDAQRRPKTPPRHPQDAPKTPQDASKTLRKAPKMLSSRAGLPKTAKSPKCKENHWFFNVFSVGSARFPGVLRGSKRHVFEGFRRFSDMFDDFLGVPRQDARKTS